MQNSILKRITSVEYLLAAILVAVFYVVIGQFDWYWLIILFLAFDLTMIGYVVNTRVGAVLYNISHSLIGPAILMTIYISTDNRVVLFVVLVWLFHIFVDRALGYGLKHSTGF
ncbi:MAG: DUF4260 family protein, partial [Actinomycetota bacterium]